MALVVDNDASGRPIVQSKSTGKIYNSHTGEDLTSKYITPTVKPPVEQNNNNNNSNNNSNSDFLDAYQSYVNEYKAMVADYQSQLDALAEENYKLQVAQNEQDAKDARNQANLNSKMTDRWLNQQYGGGVSGAGITNQLRNKTALGNTIANINNGLFSNNAQASANRYITKSTNAQNALSRYATIDDSYLNYLKQIA